MSERDGSTVGTGTAEIPVVRPAAASGPTAVQAGPEPADIPPAEGPAARDGDLVPGMQPTAPVTVRPAPRLPRRGPLTIMGPWAPVAGGFLGLLLGVVAVLLLVGTAESFEARIGGHLHSVSEVSPGELPRRSISEP